MIEDQGQRLALLPEGRRIRHHPALSAAEKGRHFLALPTVLDRGIAQEHGR